MDGPGKTPYQTFLDAKHIAYEKTIDELTVENSDACNKEDIFIFNKNEIKNTDLIPAKQNIIDNIRDVRNYDVNYTKNSDSLDS